MAAGSTYTPIATTTLSNSSSTLYTFSSIPSTYTDLVLVFNGTATTNGNTLFARFNGDTASNYSWTYMYGSGTAAGSSRSNNNSNGILMGGNNTGLSSTINSVIVLQIQDYNNTTTYKTALSKFTLAPQEGINVTVGTWRSTSAINSITIRMDLNNLNTGTVISLYGITAA